MERVAFKWWPWGVAAACVPLLVVMAGLFTATCGLELGPKEALLVGLAALGTGNGLLVGLAIGRPRRAIPAILMGCAGVFLVVGTTEGPQTSFIADGAQWLFMGVALSVHWSVESLFQSICACGGAAFRCLAATLIGFAILFSMERLKVLPELFEDKLAWQVSGVFLACLGNLLAIRFLFKHTFRADQTSSGGVAWQMSREELDF